MTELAREYGDGLYALACEEHIADEVLQELHTLKSSFRENPQFLQLLGNMALGKAERVGILDAALRGQVHPYVLNFLKLLCERGALNEFGGCEEAYRRMYNADNRVMEAVVTTAVPLAEDKRQQLIDRLCSMTGRKIQLTEKIDPQVMGGVLLEMDGKRWDNTVRHRLQDIHRAMVGEA